MSDKAPDAADLEAAQPLRHELRLNFLLEMSSRASELSGEKEVCAFVCDGAALLLDCARASIMVYEEDSGTLRIVASVGIPEHIAARTIVRPGEGISGRVFETGEEVFVGAEDAMPSNSLGVGELKGTPSFLSVPLVVPGEVAGAAEILGVINLTRKIAGGPFTSGDLKLVRAVASHTAAQMQKCRLINSERERRRLAQEVRIAADIQLSLLPEEPLRVGRLEVAGVCRPATQVGGDFLDYWEHDGHVCMLVADVSGHNIGAALMAASLRSVVRAESGHRQSVAQLARLVNRAIDPDLSRSELLVTLCYMEAEAATGRLTSCCCGHPAPLVLRDGKPIWLRAGGPLLGIGPQVTFEEGCLELRAGDLLTVCTDGVFEAGLPEKVQFGSAGVLSVLQGLDAPPPLAAAQSVIRAAQRYAGIADLPDDATVLTARFVDPR